MTQYMISAQIPTELLERIESARTALGINRSEFVRRALEAYTAIALMGIAATAAEPDSEDDNDTYAHYCGACGLGYDDSEEHVCDLDPDYRRCVDCGTTMHDDTDADLCETCNEQRLHVDDYVPMENDYFCQDAQ